jgi:hypothetical protein
MKNIKFTYVDSVTRVSVAKEPAANGPEFPKIKGLQYLFARESLYPTHVPEFIGTCHSDAKIIDGWIQELTEEELQRERGYEIDFEGGRVRHKRNMMLAQCDWTQLNDSPVNKEDWATYRQALRDIPQQEGFPWEVQWPNQPE